MLGGVRYPPSTNLRNVPHHFLTLAGERRAQMLATRSRYDAAELLGHAGFTVQATLFEGAPFIVAERAAPPAKHPGRTAPTVLICGRIDGAFPVHVFGIRLADEIDAPLNVRATIVVHAAPGPHVLSEFVRRHAGALRADFALTPDLDMSPTAGAPALGLAASDAGVAGSLIPLEAWAHPAVPMICAALAHGYERRPELDQRFGGTASDVAIAGAIGIPYFLIPSGAEHVTSAIAASAFMFHEFASHYATRLSIAHSCA